MASEIGQISFYLAKAGNDFDSVIDEDKLQPEGDYFKIREFEIDGVLAKFFCLQKSKRTVENPPWLDFVNEKITVENQIHFETQSTRPSGLLLLNINTRILAATFGASGGTLLQKHKFVFDFGIKTAMNMCGNKELRQTRSSTHAITTQNIDRQLSKPSESFSFGLSETEFLEYISAHLENDKKITLQGKNTLTIKVIGEDKLSWERLIEYGTTFIEQYDSDRYRELFPNYPNLQDVEAERAEELDLLLMMELAENNYDRIHLSIPEFIADDIYSFSYSNHPKKNNKVFSHVDISHLRSENLFDLENMDIAELKRKHVFAYSHEEDRILSYRKWSLYDCIVAEAELDGLYYVLAGGNWRQVDNDFYNSVEDFIKNSIQEIPVPDEYLNLEISDLKAGQNREEIFNNLYCQINPSAIKFDQAKLRVGQGKKDKEFCDILERRENQPYDIIHVKKYGGASSLTYLFSQAKFYCEFFLCDSVFLSEIRDYIQQSGHALAEQFLNHVKENQADVTGTDYAVRLWVLYDNRKAAPVRSTLPLMAKYELKLAYERLRNVNKYSDITLSMIPVTMVSFTKIKNNKEP